MYSDDVLCHVEPRAQVLADVFRIHKSGGRFLFSDALVIGGLFRMRRLRREVLAGCISLALLVRMSV